MNWVRLNQPALSGITMNTTTQVNSTAPGICTPLTPTKKHDDRRESEDHDEVVDRDLCERVALEEVELFRGVGVLLMRVRGS